MIEVVIEEYEQGTWVAELTDLVPYAGTFVVNATDDWVGTAKASEQQAEKFLTKIVGGLGNLSKVIPDWYSKGAVSIGAALQIICANGPEVMGTPPAGSFLPVYQRLRGTVAQALDELALATNNIWWIDREGAVNMAAARPVGPEAAGIQEDGGGDDSVTLIEPDGVVLGGTYNGQTIRHIRWHWRADRFAAQLYFVPFLFRGPLEQSIYACQYDAKVDKDNGDGTVDVIAAGRFGVTKVPLYSGIPGSKIKVKPGELVTLGFLAANPQAPYAVANGQNQAATKLVARKGDPITPGSLAFTYVPNAGLAPSSLAIIYTPGNGGAPQSLPVGSGTITLGENVNGGSARVALDDG